MNTNNRIAEIKKRLKQGKYYVPHAPDDIEYLLSELSKTRLERNQLEANKNYYKEQLAKAEAEGRLVVLPCKSGDTVYCITSPYNVTTDEEDFEKPKQVYEAVVGSMTFYSNSSQIRLNHNGEFITHYFQLTDFGKTVFLTEMEAKEVLKCQK